MLRAAPSLLMLGLALGLLGLYGCQDPAPEPSPQPPSPSPAEAPTDIATGDAPETAPTPAEDDLDAAPSESEAEDPRAEEELAMVPPAVKVVKSELDAHLQEYRLEHPEEGDGEEGADADAAADPSRPSAVPDPRLGVFGPAGVPAIRSILSLITTGGDVEVHGDEVRGVVTARYMGQTVDLTYFSARGDRPGPALRLPRGAESRARFAVEGVIPETVVLRWSAVGGSTPEAIPEDQREVIIDGEAFGLRGSVRAVAGRIEESGGSSLKLVPQDERGTAVYQDADDPRHFVWVQGVSGTDMVQVTLVTVSALPEPLERSLAVLAGG